MLIFALISKSTAPPLYSTRARSLAMLISAIPHISRWRVSSNSYLSRGMGKMCGGDVGDIYAWPTCSSHHSLATSYGDFYSWVWESLYDPHGPVHIWIGGVLDCDQTYELIGDLVGEEIASALSLYSFLHRKNLYRDGFFTCEGTATVDKKAADVSFRGRMFLGVISVVW